MLICSERPIQENFVSADTDNQQVLPILSADISAENEAKNWDIEPQNLYRIFLIWLWFLLKCKFCVSNGTLSTFLDSLAMNLYFGWTYLVKYNFFRVKIRHFWRPIISVGWPILSADIIGRIDRYYRPIYRYRSYTSLLETIWNLVMKSSFIVYTE